MANATKQTELVTTAKAVKHIDVLGKEKYYIILTQGRKTKILTSGPSTHEWFDEPQPNEEAQLKIDDHANEQGNTKKWT